MILQTLSEPVSVDDQMSDFMSCDAQKNVSSVLQTLFNGIVIHVGLYAKLPLMTSIVPEGFCCTLTFNQRTTFKLGCYLS